MRSSKLFRVLALCTLISFSTVSVQATAVPGSKFCKSAYEYLRKELRISLLGAIGGLTIFGLGLQVLNLDSKVRRMEQERNVGKLVGGDGAAETKKQLLMDRLKKASKSEADKIVMDLYNVAKEEVGDYQLFHFMQPLMQHLSEKNAHAVFKEMALRESGNLEWLVDWANHLQSEPDAKAINDAYNAIRDAIYNKTPPLSIDFLTEFTIALSEAAKVIPNAEADKWISQFKKSTNSVERGDILKLLMATQNSHFQEAFGKLVDAEVKRPINDPLQSLSHLIAKSQKPIGRGLVPAIAPERLIEKALKSADPSVRSDAASALKKMGTPGDALAQQIAKVLAETGSGGKPLDENLATALGKHIFENDNPAIPNEVLDSFMKGRSRDELTSISLQGPTYPLLDIKNYRLAQSVLSKLNSNSPAERKQALGELRKGIGSHGERLSSSQTAKLGQAIQKHPDTLKEFFSRENLLQDHPFPNVVKAVLRQFAKNKSPSEEELKSVSAAIPYIRDEIAAFSKEPFVQTIADRLWKSPDPVSRVGALELYTLSDRVDLLNAVLKHGLALDPKAYGDGNHTPASEELLYVTYAIEQFVKVGLERDTSGSFKVPRAQIEELPNKVQSANTRSLEVPIGNLKNVLKH